jgi:membrane-associated phospholipid phosphatase
MAVPPPPAPRDAGARAASVAPGTGQPPARDGAPGHPTTAPRVIRRLLGICFASIVLTAAAYTLTVGTPLGQLMSELILGGRTGAVDAVRTAEDVLSTLSRATLAAGGVAVIALALLQRREGLAVVAAGTVLGANLTTQLLKSIVLERSDLLDSLFYALPNSFPSGHVTAAASIAVALVLVLPPLLRSPIVVVGSMAVALLGASTMLAGWHRMADVIGGTFVAVAWGSGLAALLVWRTGVGHVGRRTAAVGRLSARFLVGAAVVVLLIGTLAYLLALIDPLNVLLLLAERGGSPALLGVGLLIAAGASLLAFGALGFALRDVRLDPPSTPPRARRRGHKGPGRDGDAGEPVGDHVGGQVGLGGTDPGSQPAPP